MHVDNARLVRFPVFCLVFLACSTPPCRHPDVETFSLLIPMEKLFEEFIAAVLIDDPAYFFGRGVNVSAQGRIGHLVQKRSGGRLFSLIPDLLAEGPGGALVIDTKYKLLDEAENAYDVSQADAYQMFAYVVKIRAKAGMLLYPDTELKSSLDVSYEVKDEGKSRKIPLLIRSVRLSHALTTKECW